MTLTQLTTSELAAGLSHIRDALLDQGTLELIVRRPAVDQREVIEVGELDLEKGLIGDNWIDRRSRSTSDGSPHPLMQLNVMNARAISLIAGEPERWALAGDQLYLDLDLSHENLPAGARLAIGDAVIEVTEPPHRGCQKFSNRFGQDALRFVNSQVGRALRLRGLNARVVVAGTIRRGDVVTKLPIAVTTV
ncbi:MAG: MOSC domain-containing protein [Acidimicrobiia bacterium]